MEVTSNTYFRGVRRLHIQSPVVQRPAEKRPFVLIQTQRSVLELVYQLSADVGPSSFALTKG